MFGCTRRGPAAALRDAMPVRVAALAVACLLGLSLLSVSAASAAGTSTTCQPYSSTPCLFPFPDNRLTKPDHGSATGLQLNLPQAAMPVNVLRTQVSAAPYDQNDGFSPGSAILLHIPQLETQAALNKTHAVGLLNLSAYKAKNAPIMVIDEKTGQRQMIYAQLDANATSAATRNLMVLPASNWQDGHTYVVVMRDLRNAGGHLISAPAWFEKLRDGKRLPASERSQAKRYATIFKVLKRAKVAQDKTLFAAWDFTVASTKELTGQLLAIRNAAFGQLGDANLGDGQVQGTAPAFSFVRMPATRQRSPVSGRHRHLPGSVLPADLRRLRHHRLHLHLDRAVRDADADPGQRRHGGLRMRDPADSHAVEPRADRALRARPARRHGRGDGYARD